MRRHRRLVAGVLAGAAALIALTGLRGPQAPTTQAPVADPTAARAGEVSVPVTLANAALASVLHVGDVIDLVSVADPAAPDLIAHSARVLQVPSSGGMLTSGSTAVVLVAVPAAVGLDVTAAASQEALTFMVPAPEHVTGLG